LQGTIDFQTVRSFTQLLNNNQKTIVKSKKIIEAIESLIETLDKIEIGILENRSETASKQLSEMTEEDRRVLLMAADEKKFFLEFKEKYPNNKWDYYKEYQKSQQEKSGSE